MASLPTAAETVSFGEFQANLRSRELLKQGSTVRLPDQSFQILAILLERPGELVTREEIKKRLWPGDTFVDFDHGLNNAVNRLREALRDSADSPRFIETLLKRGYRFIGTINRAGPAENFVSHPSLQIEPEFTRNPADADQKPELVRSHVRRWLVLAVLAILALGIGVMWNIHGASDLPSSRSLVLPPEGTTFNLIGDNGGSVVLSPDGKNLAFVAENSKGVTQIWVRPLARLAADPVLGTEGATFPFWSPDGKSLGFFARAQLKRIRLDGTGAVTLCQAPFGRGGSWGTGGVIIFAPNWESGIYRVSDSGGVPTPITTVDSAIHTSHRWPRFLPDGRHFVYFALSHFPDAGQNGAYLASLDGKENRLLVPTDADAAYAAGRLFFLRKGVLMVQRFDPQRGLLLGEPRVTEEKVLYDPAIWKAVFDVSDRGVMAYELGGIVHGNQFQWFDRSGRQIGVLGEPSFQWEPSISRSGNELAVGITDSGGTNSNLWVYDLKRGGRRQITFDQYDHGTPIWSPDDSRVLFATKHDHYTLYEVDSRGLTSPHPILDTGSDVWPLDLSRDGRFLLYGKGQYIGRSRGQLWVLPRHSGGTPFRLLSGDAPVTDGQFSPDGRWVAYTTNENGRDEVYVVPFRAGSSTDKAVVHATEDKWRISTSGGRWPRWRRDGTELIYLSSNNTLVAVPVPRSGPSFTIGREQPLFRVNPGYYNLAYDISPDASRFIVNTGAEEKTAPITLVENWLTDFNE